MYIALVCKVTVSRKRACKSLNNVLLQSLQYQKATIIFIIYIEGWVRKKKRFPWKTIDSCEISKKIIGPKL